MNGRICILLMIAAGLGSCKKSDDPIPDMGYDFFPIEQGSYIDYSVEYITYDDFQDPVKIDTSNYWIREVQDTSFLDNEGRLSYALLRYRKDSLNGSWNLERRWYFTQLADRLERVEENIRTIHLSYPVRSGRIWDGNLYNEKDEVLFNTAQLGFQTELNGQVYNNCCKNIHENNINLIERQYGEEVYGFGIGMISKEQVDLKTSFEGEIQSGFELRMKIVEHGVL